MFPIACIIVSFSHMPVINIAYSTPQCICPIIFLWSDKLAQYGFRFRHTWANFLTSNLQNQDMLVISQGFGVIKRILSAK